TTQRSSCAAKRSALQRGLPALRKQCESSSYPSFFSFPAKWFPLRCMLFVTCCSSHVVHHWDQLPHDFHDDRSNGHDKQRRQNTKEDREHQLDAQFGGFLFSHLAGLHPHIVG